MSIIKPYQFEPQRSSSGEASNSRTGPSRQGSDDPDPHRVLDNSWCRCGHCTVMPTATECVCCAEVPKVVSLCRAEGTPFHCISESRYFAEICLLPHVLSTVTVLLHDVTASAGEEPMSNRFASCNVFLQIVPISNGTNNLLPYAIT